MTSRTATSRTGFTYVLPSPVVANGTLYVATTAGWLWAVGQQE